MSKRITDHGQRIAMVEYHQRGESLAAIAAKMNLNYYTVRKWWRAYQQDGFERLVPQPSGPAPTGAMSQFGPLVKYVALRLKREHPAWGLDLLLLHLRRRPSLAGQRFPGRSTLGAYFQSFAPRLKEHRPLRTRRPAATPVQPVEAVHECWQMDFKGDERVPGVGLVKPLVICDKLTSAPLAGLLHADSRPHKQKVQLTSRDVQQDLRQVFSQWGLPDQLQMDRDPIWVGSARLEWPGFLLLWLVGLGIQPLINRAHRPTDNAQVERTNRTWDEHVRIGAKAQSLPQLQATTDQAWRDRRECLPSRNPHCHGLPPLLAQPALAQPRRPYSPDQEADLFDMTRVYTYLAQWEWQRQIDTTGFISMAHLNRRISPLHIGQIVKVRFDPARREFVAFSVGGTELRRFTLTVISADYIRGIDPGGT